MYTCQLEAVLITDHIQLPWRYMIIVNSNFHGIDIWSSTLQWPTDKLVCPIQEAHYDIMCHIQRYQFKNLTEIWKNRIFSNKWNFRALRQFTTYPATGCCKLSSPYYWKDQQWITPTPKTKLSSSERGRGYWLGEQATIYEQKICQQIVKLRGNY